MANFLIFFSALLFLSTPVSSQLNELFFPGFKDLSTDITLRREAKIKKSGILCLTNYTSRVQGQAFHSSPIQFKNYTNGQVFSFSTSFALGIVPEYPKLGGHGLAFTFSTSKDLIGLPSQYLGLFNSTNMGNFSDHLFAVEFDTVQDFDSTKQNLNLKSGAPILAWIDYDASENLLNKGVNLKVYKVSSIMLATDNFSSETKLGEGGFGPVYKGLLPDGQEVAVKRLSGRSKQGLVEFKNELIIVAKLQHTNLVRLLGFCIQGEEKILVYEYMPNKSLDTYIFDESKRKLFDWNKYFNIIEEIAQGLLYLHKYSRLKIIHRDLKAGNILLDKNMNPKISDFGMAKVFTTTHTEANTNRVVGTRGYMAPEYAIGGIFSEKSDVFSFGVLILEIISGRRSNNNIFYDGQPLNLVAYVSS
ncbi:hypothetical protein Patl1_22985 [Pistacia atlantica]|uniref:Uncharacterized protein n=1 Tax=Pistacia atlantica TaxID=434234 RepID=A0ACC0ZXA1_9ROSI|nr:hypothetical protein Patl1_22985 [Pistacia atlantica]